MPELPEVKTVVKYLNEDVSGLKILDSDFLVPKMIKNIEVNKLKSEIKNRKIIEVTNYGKFILFSLDNNKTLITHLRMEGKYRFINSLELDKHDHAWFKFNKGYLIYKDVRKFGTFELKLNEDVYTTKPLDKLGKLPSKINDQELFKKLNKKSIAIKSALLDQTIILGLGNIYVDEVLFDAKILPTRKSNTISIVEINKIIKSATKIIKKAIEEGGSSIRTYLAYGTKKGNYQNYLKVHTKAGESCPVCKSKILKTKVNGRGTYYCSKCQK